MRGNVKSAKEIREEIGRHYDKNSKGWKVSIGRDTENYISSLFLQNNQFWMIKEFAVNPYKSLGLGIKGKARGERKLKEIKIKTGFGLRPLDSEQTNALLKGGQNIVEEILETSPLPSDACSSSPVIMTGPISISNQLQFISKAQEKLDRKLRKNLRDLIFREYPGMARSYR